MGIYKRHDSPFWWMLLERPGEKPIRRSTGIPTKGRSVVQERQREQDALDIYRCVLADLAREQVGLPIRSRPKPERPIVTFGAFAEDYFKSNPYRDSLAKLIAKWSDCPLTSITPADFDRYREERLAAGTAPTTLHKELALLRGLLQKAVERGHLGESPVCCKFPKASKKPTLRRILSHGEETRLLSYLSPEDQAIFLVGQDALVRLGNILELRWEDDQGSALVIAKSKTSAYTPPISTRLRTALDALPHTGEFIFPSRRTAAGGMKSWQRAYLFALKAAAQKAGIPWGRVHGRTFHWSTRRTGASRMLSRGADFKKVQKIGNWSSLKVLLEIYAEAEDEGLADAVELVGAADRRLRLVHSQSRDTHVGKKTS